MLNIEELRKADAGILFIGSHPGIIQSILDFDYLSGKSAPSVIAVIATNRKYEKYFFGSKEVLIPVYESCSAIPKSRSKDITLFYNVTSARRVLTSSKDAFMTIPSIQLGVIFAEDVPEEHSLLLREFILERSKILLGPASVGLLLPGILKLGAIGGVDYRQLMASHVFDKGDTAVFSASGGMTNEIIRIVSLNQKRLSFALSFGGDRFPVLTPEDAFLAAENDPATKMIVYFGELGGTDEYALIDLMKEKKITKPIVCYIGGVVAELFETPPQFGHAKAMAQKGEETARAKRDALRAAGAKVAESFADFIEYIGRGEVSKDSEFEYTNRMDDLQDRKHALITTTISNDDRGEVQVLGEPLLDFVSSRPFASIVGSMFLGKKTISKELEEFVDFTLRLLVEHGPYVSGSVNTIVTARAGRDLVSSLATGLLTIGPRFGGAINQAASNWIAGVKDGKDPSAFVEEFASKKEYISGIGHRKYRVDAPDPRVAKLLSFIDSLAEKKYSSFAKSVEKVTVAKKGNLILNVDGAIAAILLDILSEKEGMKVEELENLVKTEFFNALFVLSRSVGFISHFLDQKRIDEGLFRLDEEHVTYAKDLFNE
ncbi:MAG: hypothetical protein KBC15_03645 [Candidatus Levybacteria bacterium]|nr:hypothetical protein [Candidatus Levybacteria bacterium]